MTNASTMAVSCSFRLPFRSWHALCLAILVGASCSTAPKHPERYALARPSAHSAAEHRAVSLIRDFDGNDVRRWMKARQELVAIGAPAAPFLIYAMATGDSVKSTNCLDTLIDIGPAAADKLSAVLDCESANVRKNAAEALGKVGAAAPKAKLREMTTSDEAWPVRSASARALGELQDRQSAPALRTCLSDKEPVVRESAAWALGEIGDHAAIPALEKIMLSKGEPAEVRAAAKEALNVLTGRRPKSHK